MNINKAADGFVKLSKAMEYSDLVNDQNAFVVFVRMLMMAHHQDDFTSIRFAGKQTKLKRGEFSATLTELSVHFNLPKSTLKNVINRLKSDTRLDTRTDHQITIFRICNYAKYQDKPSQRKTHDMSNDLANDMSNVTEGKKNIKERKDIDTNVSIYKPRQSTIDINEMFELWEEQVGYPINGNIKANRYACSNLIKRHKRVNVETLIRCTAAAVRDKHAPRVSDFVSLQSKQNDLILWARKQSINGSKKVVTV